MKLSIHLQASPLEKTENPIQLKTIQGLEASFKISPTKISVSLYFQEPQTITESRWRFGRLMTQIKALFKIESVEIAKGRSVSQKLYEALALDLKSKGNTKIVSGKNIDQLEKLAEYEAGFRQWVDEDAQERTSLKIAQEILAYADQNDQVDAFVLDDHQIKDLGMNLLMAVGGASKKSPPRLIVATYGSPDPAEAPPLMLVGKGITFDSGGINVKAYENFVSMMKNDMGGAALAWHLFKALAESDYPQPLVLVIPTCENPIGEEAMRPGSVVKSHRGISVRIDHTDAEGRLILADALSWASSLYQPKEIFTFATLTTAALIGYGPFATPVHFASPQLQKALTQSSEEVGEDLHFFPYRIWHQEANKDHEADLKNTASLSSHASRGAGSRNAAHFLIHFADAPLTHFDIFASTWDWSNQSPSGTSQGATGSPFRSLYHGLWHYAQLID
jgi:leucyl aminopeptidase